MLVVILKFILLQQPASMISLQVTFDNNFYDKSRKFCQKKDFSFKKYIVDQILYRTTIFQFASIKDSYRPFQQKYDSQKF